MRTSYKVADAHGYPYYMSVHALMDASTGDLYTQHYDNNFIRVGSLDRVSGASYLNRLFGSSGQRQDSDKVYWFLFEYEVTRKVTRVASVTVQKGTVYDNKVSLYGKTLKFPHRDASGKGQWQMFINQVWGYAKKLTPSATVMAGGSVASANVLSVVEQGAFAALDAYFSSTVQRGGSMASDAVMALVQPEAWTRMNAWFTNRIADMTVQQQYGGAVQRGGSTGCDVTSAIEAVTAAAPAGDGPAGAFQTDFSRFSPPVQEPHPGNSLAPYYTGAASLPDVNVQPAYDPNVQLPFPTGVKFMY